MSNSEDELSTSSEDCEKASNALRSNFNRASVLRASEAGSTLKKTKKTLSWSDEIVEASGSKKPIFVKSLSGINEKEYSKTPQTNEAGNLTEDGEEPSPKASIIRHSDTNSTLSKDTAKNLSRRDEKPALVKHKSWNHNEKTKPVFRASAPGNFLKDIKLTHKDAFAFSVPANMSCRSKEEVESSSSFDNDVSIEKLKNDHHRLSVTMGSLGQGIRFSQGLIIRQEMQERPKLERKPMTTFDRFLKQGKSMRFGLGTSETDVAAENSSSNFTKKQFTVTKTTAARPSSRNVWSYINTSFLRRRRVEEVSTMTNDYLTSYINWTFRSGFLIVVASFIFMFFFVIMFFTTLLIWAGQAKPQCIISGGVGGEDATGMVAPLEDAFSLSWTTFSTVGYGGVYPSAGGDYGEQLQCFPVFLLCAVESFFGLLMAGLFTSIMFAKIGRIQSHAQVTFSEVLCVEYGKREVRSSFNIDNSKGALSEVNISIKRPHEGLEFLAASSDSSTSSSSDESDEECTGRLQCPVLKFQLVNNLSNEPHGEILDAKVNVMVQKENPKNNDKHQGIPLFNRLELVEAEHPYFTHLWHCRHILDENSPLLSMQARKALHDNDGYWPTEWNNTQAVRKAIHFNSIIVTMTGLSNISSESVQIAKRYYFADLVFGYNFAPICYNDDVGRLAVDMKLINDVVEQ